MIQTFTFELPPTLNQQINSARTHWAKSAADKRIWTNACAVSCWGGTPFEGEVWLEYVWCIASKANDQDNIWSSAKYILDGMQEAGIIKNDNLTIIQSPAQVWYKYAERNNQHCIVTISDSPDFLWQNLEYKIKNWTWKEKTAKAANAKTPTPKLPKGVSRLVG